MNDRRHHRARLRYLEQLYANRPVIEKALLDNGLGIYLIVPAVIVIWAIELTANVRQAGNWSFIAHLIVVGSLEILLLGYFSFIIARKLLLRWRIRRLRHRAMPDEDDAARCGKGHAQKPGT